MNERIKELAEQVGSVYQKNLDVYLLRHDELEKFAELIVDECLAICEELGDKGMDGHYCADAISKKFRS